MLEWFKKKIKEKREKDRKALIIKLSKLSFESLWELRVLLEKDKIPARPHTHDCVPCMVCGQFRICVQIFPSVHQDFKRMLICDECMERELMNWWVDTSPTTHPVSETGEIGMESPEDFLQKKCVRI